MKKDIAINDKDEKKSRNLLTMNNNSDGDSNSKLRPSKFSSFSSFIRQVIWNNLRDRNDTADKR